MTLIECFTDSHIDNIAACLRLQPEKMIMVGKADEMAAPVNRYRKLLNRRRMSTEIVLCDVRGKNFGDICGVIGALVKAEGECVIDLTGGDEPVILAVGAVLAGLDPDTRQRLRVEKYDRDVSGVVDCIHDNREIPHPLAELTVEELIALHGGSLYTDHLPFLEDCTHRDVEQLWRLASEAPKEWNRAITYLNELERGTDLNTHIRLPLEEFRRSANFVSKETVIRELLDQLHRCGIIEDRSSRDVLDYTYQSPMLRYCTRKAGNVLEIKTLLEGRAVLKNGKAYFQDCRMGASIDWDGTVHHPSEKIADTRNEIDVILMHGLTPLFISCKNGNIGEEELYKLHTVAHRFGGTYAKKMLIATDLDQKSLSANRSFIQRARDMDIFLEPGAAHLSREEWQQIFIKAVK